MRMKLRTLKEQKREGLIPRKKFIWFPTILENPYSIQWFGFAWKINVYGAFGAWGGCEFQPYYFGTKELAEEYLKRNIIKR